MSTPKSVSRIRLRQVRDGSVRFVADKISSPEAVVACVAPFYKGLDREALSIFCVDSHCQPIAFHVVALGQLNAARARPADILKAALVCNANGILLVHNHPSGVCEPSEDDVLFTRSVHRACQLLGIDLLDHIVVTDDSYTSLRSRGLLP